MRAGGDKRGNSRDRARRRAWMLETWGDGTEAPCIWCGRALCDDTIEADRIEEGGSYRRGNIVPACRVCNLARSDTPATRFAIIAERPTGDIIRDLVEAKAQPTPR